MVQSIAIGLSPNTDDHDAIRALQMMCMPWKWIDGPSIDHVIETLSKYSQTPYVHLFNSARSALFTLLTAFGISKGDEVIIQAFTCVAVPNAVLWTGATPIYADIDDSYNLDIEDVEKKITAHTKAIIVQHTFGIPGNIEALRKICEINHLFLIEDCAHSFGSTYKGKNIGSFGDGAIYSFGRDKVVSSVCGGALTLSPKYISINDQIELMKTTIPQVGRAWIWQQLCHPIFMVFIKKWYSTFMGKGLLFLLQKIHVLSLPIQEIEKKSQQPREYPALYPNALAYILEYQLSKREKMNRMRITHAKRYVQELAGTRSLTVSEIIPEAIYHRFPLVVPDAERLMRSAKQQSIILGNWFHNVIDPTGVDLIRVKYKAKSCKNAERIAKSIVNLPTGFLTSMQVEKIIQLVRAHIDE